MKFIFYSLLFHYSSLQVQKLIWQFVYYRYGEQAAHATSEGLDAAGHALGTAWVAFKIRKAINPKSVIKPTTLAKSVAKAAASDYKSSKSK